MLGFCSRTVCSRYVLSLSTFVCAVLAVSKSDKKIFLLFVGCFSPYPNLGPSVYRPILDGFVCGFRLAGEFALQVSCGVLAVPSAQSILTCKLSAMYVGGAGTSTCRVVPFMLNMVLI